MSKLPWHHKLELRCGRPSTPQSFGPLEHRDCPLCGNTRYRSVLENQYYPLAELDVMSVAECQRCSLIFTNPIPSAKWYETFLSPKVNIWWDEPVWTTYEWQDQNSRDKFIDGLSIIRRILPNGTLIDVGTGPGLFVRLALETGYSAVGFDILPEGVTRAKTHNIPIVLGKSSGMEFNAKFDVVTLWCVIAHEANFVELVRDCRRALRPGGVILVETPNMTLWRLLRKPRALLERLRLTATSHDALSAYGHINHFTARTLSYLLKECGFVDIRFYAVRNYGTERGIVDWGKHLLFTTSRAHINFCFPLVATARKM